jgi:hypothetical protein
LYHDENVIEVVTPYSLVGGDTVTTQKATIDKSFLAFKGTVATEDLYWTISGAS